MMPGIAKTVAPHLELDYEKIWRKSVIALWVGVLLLLPLTTALADTTILTDNLTVDLNPLPPRTVGAPVDTDKSHGGTGGWNQNYYDDLNTNGSHDPGEPFAEDPQGGWTNTVGPDNSCWLASACNMLEQVGVIADASVLYNNYALNGVPDGGGGTLTWDEGGLQEHAIQYWMNQNPGSGLTMNTLWASGVFSNGVYAWEDYDPRPGVDNYLNTGWEVGIGMWPLLTDGQGSFWHEDGHALTIQDILVASGFDCTDSDRDTDFSGPGDVNTYNDATVGPVPSGGHNYYGWYNDFYDGNITVYPAGDVSYICAVIPEPATMGLLLLGGLLLLRRRRK